MTQGRFYLLCAHRGLNNFLAYNSKWIPLIIIFFSFSLEAVSQSVTTITIDFRGKKDTSVTFLNASRNGNICSGSNCIRFNVILDPGSDLVSLDIQKPAPTGASAFYQIDCGPSTSLATPVCISNRTSVSITYCKTGNDRPDYIISASSVVKGSGDLNLRVGCSGLMSVTGLQKSTVTWTSIFPGAQGLYDTYLSCLTACDSTTVVPKTGAPTFIDYLVTGTANNCSSTRRDTIRVYTYPALTASIAPANPAICSGASTTLTATPTGGSGPYTYSWAPGSATTSSIPVSTVGTYTVTVRDTISGCPAVSQPVTVTAAATPSAPTAAGTTVCTGSTATLTATAPGGTYRWYNTASGGTLLASNATYTTPALTANTTYYVETTVGGCPSARTAVTASVTPIPAAPTATGITICSGNTASLTATAPGGVYEWYAAASGGATLATGASYTSPVLSATTTYYVQTTLNSCTGPRTAVTATVTPLPSAPTATGSIICSGNTTSLTATAPGGTYQWYDAASGGNLLATNATYTSPVLNTTNTYYVQTTVNSCTSNTRTAVTVTVNPTPVPPTAAGTTICSGNTATLSATAPGGIYRWYDAASGGALLATGTGYTTPVLTATTTYYVDASSAAGCTGARTAVTVTITPVANPAFTYSSGTFCKTGTNPTPVIVGSASGTFSATPVGLVFISTSTGQINLGASTLGTYTISFVTNGPCVYSSSSNITVTNSPNAAFVYNGPYCQKQTNPIPVFTPGASAGIFSTTQSGLIFQNASTGEINLVNSLGGAYTITNTIAASAGCAAATATNSVTINTLATVDAGSNQTVCAAAAVTLTGTIGGSAGSATWSGGTGSFSNASSLTTFYTPGSGETTAKLFLTSNDPAGPCDAVKDSVSIIITPTPAAPTAAGTTICAGTTTSVTASAPGGTYQWYDAASGGNLLASNTTHSTPVLTANTTYYVQSTLNGCAGPRTAVMVTVTPTPAAPTAISNTICSGSSTTLTATAPGGTYEWYDATANGTLLATSAGYTTSLLNTTTTYYIQTTVNGCTSNTRTPVTVTVNTTPAAPTASGMAICSGNKATITATAPGGAYRWYSAATGGSILTSSAAYTTPILTTTNTYYIEASSAEGCTGTRTAVTVSVTPIDNPAFSYSSGTFCVSGTNPTPFVAGSVAGTFSASPAGLVFVNTATGQINVSASALGTYSINFVTSGACVYSSSANVTITNFPNAAFAYNGPYCQKITNPLPGFTTGASAGVFSASPAGLVFQNASTGEINLINSTAGTYTVTNIIAASGGCIASTATNTVSITTWATVTAGPTQIVCASVPVTLAGTTGGSASSGTWSGGRGNFSNTALLNTTYTPAAGEDNVKLFLSSNDPAGPCEAVMDSINILVTTAPSLPTVATAGICAGNATALTATAPGGIYQWYDAASGGNLLANNPTYATPVLSTTSTYYVQSTTNGCAGPRTAVTANVTPLPNAPTAAAATVCSGNTASLIATAPGGSYQWHDAAVNGNLLASNANFTTPVLNTTTTYYVQTSVNGCTGARTPVIVTANPTPATPAISSNSPICVGSLLNLTTTAVTGATYSWSGPNNFSSSIQNPTITDIIAASAGIYSVTTTVNACTSNVGTININPVITAPTAGSNSPVCEGTALALTASSIAGANYSWRGPNGFASITQNPTAAGTLLNSGTYFVTAFLAGCPGLSDSAVVNINPIPTTPVLSANSPLCAGNSISLNAAAIKGATYKWTGPNGFLSMVQNPIITNSVVSNGGIYNVSVTTAGCSGTSTSSLPVMVNPIPNTPVAGNNGPLCEGSGLTLFATTIPGAAYSWAGPAAFSSTQQNPSLTGTTVANADTFKVVAIVNGCASMPATTIPIINTLSKVIAGNDQTVCANNAMVNLAGTVTGGSVTGIWTSSGSGTFSRSNTSLNITYRASNTDTAAGNVILSLRSTNNGACPAIVSSLSVRITDAPTANAGNDQRVCSNEANINLSGSVTTASGGIWSSSGTGRFSPANTDLNAIYIPGTRDLSNGMVTLLLTTTGNEGCLLASDSKTLTITPTPIVNAGPDRLVFENGTIRLEPVVNGVNLQYEWKPNLFLSSTSIKNPVVTGKNNQLYTLRVTGEGGCMAEDQTFVKVLKPIIVPNIFTPNGDGMHDVWNIEQLANYPDATVEVYTRTGQKIYTSIGYDQPWNGNYNNKPVPVATYYYIINPKLTGTILSGSVTVIR